MGLKKAWRPLKRGNINLPLVFYLPYDVQLQRQRALSLFHETTPVFAKNGGRHTKGHTSGKSHYFYGVMA